MKSLGSSVTDRSIDFTERWIINDNWTYTADLSPFTETIVDNFTDQSTLLVFYGIDTIANIVSISSRHSVLEFIIVIDFSWTFCCVGQQPIQTIRL